MSGDFVQRGEPAVFNKHARAAAAAECGADLVIELPVPYALSSAEGFAAAGVYILDRLGVCDFISFGSESGDIGSLTEAARAMNSAEADKSAGEWLDKGLSYASAQQKAADAVLGSKSKILRSPNNLLGIEYLKALMRYDSQILPMTIKRAGGEHDSDSGWSASGIRKALKSGEIPWELIPEPAAAVYKNEIDSGRLPVFVEDHEAAVLSRLRMIDDFSIFPGASGGLENRIGKYAAAEPSVSAILEKTKTKRYAMSRLRRLLMCAVLGITAEDAAVPPPYIRILAMNRKGMKLLASARKKTELPVITKPSSVIKLNKNAVRLFDIEASAADFYALAHKNPKDRIGRQEWKRSPYIIDH